MFCEGKDVEVVLVMSHSVQNKLSVWT